jgi:glycosyltransferase involved in cell wall biosynthesis
MRVYPSTLHRWLDSRQMHAELATAAAIVMSTPEAAARLLQRFPSLADRPVVAIPNGFDAGTFAGSPVPRTDEAFRIVHTGYLHTELGLELRRSLPSRRFRGGSVRGLDILTRSHVMLVEALNLLLERRPDLHDVLELHLAGVLTDTDAAVAARTPVARLQGYVSHRESIDLVRSADLLFLPMQNLPLGTRATIVPGKTYEYLASGRPILAAVPDGDARDILAEAGTGILCRPDDVAAMAQAIESQVDRRLRSEPPPAPRPEVIARYEYRALARRLADVFDQVLA